MEKSFVSSIISL